MEEWFPLNTFKYPHPVTYMLFLSEKKQRVSVWANQESVVKCDILKHNFYRCNHSTKHVALYTYQLITSDLANPQVERCKRLLSRSSFVRAALDINLTIYSDKFICITFLCNLCM